MEQNLSAELDQQRSELIEKYRDINVDHEWWDYLYEDFKLGMVEKGIRIKDIFFTGFYSQGDGACFTGEIDMCKFLKAHGLEEHYMGATFFAAQGELYTTLDKNSSHYAHENTVSVNLELDNYNNYDDDTRYDIYSTMEEVMESEWKQLDNQVEEICRGYMRDLYRQLRDEYEALTSDEAVWDTIAANDLHVVEAV